MAHAMAVQTQLLQAQLATQAAELQRRLVEDARVAATGAANVTHHILQQQQQFMDQALPVGNVFGPPDPQISQGYPRSLQLSPVTWQLEPSTQYATLSGQLVSFSAATPAPVADPLVPSPTSDQ
jgi:hypothetical protein